MKNLFKTLAFCLVVILSVSPIFSAGCSQNPGEGFAIYLTSQDIPPNKMETVNPADLTDTPIIGIQDIIHYNSQTYELKVTSEAFQRICGLQVPVQGKTFVVCVNKKPIYRGAFWTPVSSIAFDGVSIWQPFKTDKTDVLSIEAGYPSSDFYEGKDPRNSPEILKSLKQVGKLINNLSIKDIKSLPRTAKGYELYSWQEDGLWNFTLIYGTNRNKTLEEITSKENIISETGTARVFIKEIEDLKIVLSRLPEDEELFWQPGFRGENNQPGIKIGIPPEEVMLPIRVFADQNGINLRLP